ncbi:UDP-Glc:alpha-D-GlcNAc-diphosphoundecaprenol beta-1,3-glucosyltransferase WfgD [Geobacter sp. OR-1]|uniref:glycosyltransferase family 2 protein n=1 Tax=Geobacter sp. OR-1 TaxID=1266765 RepID=UPI0005437973|nr:glycosyltransferase family 2 protein [Geobacter sp. OR-1]GAM11020.1 UDP-Glc:alpha-D-GlcNAc-diphosphoundecaprenol beta-1,3-glucosyltransferase WfgD [Geobacter sp. OR-1]
MKLSVCMATRNGERFIGEQLASILSQLGPDDELIISDDSSTDRTVAIIRDFADPRLRLLEGGAFYSPIFNFENALRHATGGIIALSDQDDIWLPNKVAVIRTLFNNRPGAIYLVVMDGTVIDETGREIAPSIFGCMRRSGPGVARNIFDNSYIGCSMAFSRELLDIALPFPRKIPMHDVWLGILAEIFGTTVFVPEKAVCYRKHGASMTDFGIRFIPWTQIKRRWFLSWYLFVRWVSVTTRQGH